MIFTTLTGRATAAGGATDLAVATPTYPSVRSSATTVWSSSETTQVVNMPASVGSGDLLLLFAAYDGNAGTIVGPAGWSAVISNTKPGNNSFGFLVWQKIATGAESGTTVTWSTSNQEASSALVVSVKDWGGSLVVGTPSTSNAALTIDPPLANAGSSINALWIAAGGWDRNYTVSGVPTGYTSIGTAQANSSNGVSLTVASLQATGASSDPSNGWTLSSSLGWVSTTIGVRSASGNDTLSTGESFADADGAIGYLKGDATFTTDVGGASASGNDNSLIPFGNFNTNVGTATGSGDSSVFTSDSTFTTNEPTATAGGNDSAFSGQQNVTFSTETGNADASGWPGSLVLPVSVTFSATGTGTAAAAGYPDETWIADSTFTTLEGNATASASGTTSLVSGSTFYATGTSSATTGGGIGYLKSTYVVMTTLMGTATATGRSGSIVNSDVLRGSTAYGNTSSEVSVDPDLFQAFIPDFKSSNVVTFALEPWRIVSGIPQAEAMFCSATTPEASIGVADVVDAFISPTSISGFSQYRWLSSTYATPNWPAVATGAPVAGNRTWDGMRNDFTWDTARLRSWNDVMSTSSDPSAPIWQNIGSVNASTLPTYSYWRAQELVSNPAVLVDPGASLKLAWTPSVTYPQVSLALVFVPRVPETGSYELLRASEGVRVVLNSDSTIDLIVGSTVQSTEALLARSRPNEPMVVTLSVQFNPAGSTAVGWWAHLVVMDASIKTLTAYSSGVMTQDVLGWIIAKDKNANFELLEANIYTESLTPDGLITKMGVYDRIYGVTVT